MLMIRALAPLVGAGRVKIYSCDSVAGQAWFSKEGSLEHRHRRTERESRVGAKAGAAGLAAAARVDVEELTGDGDDLPLESRTK